MGNLVALPYARKSVPLGINLKPVSWEDFIPPTIETHFNPDVSTIYEPPPPKKRKAAKTRKTTPKATISSEVLPGDDKEVREALKYVEADDYDIWIKFGLAIKNSLGAAAFDTSDEWAKISAK